MIVKYYIKYDIIIVFFVGKNLKGGTMAREKSTIERRSFGIRLNPALVKELKILAAQRETQVNLLLEEAIRDFLEKCREE